MSSETKRALTHNKVHLLFTQAVQTYSDSAVVIVKKNSTADETSVLCNRSVTHISVDSISTQYSTSTTLKSLITSGVHRRFKDRGGHLLHVRGAPRPPQTHITVKLQSQPARCAIGTEEPIPSRSRCGPCRFYQPCQWLDKHFQCPLLPRKSSFLLWLQHL